MALVLGVNSYVTSAEADVYFTDRLDVAAWTAASDVMKDQALVTASQWLDTFRYAGYATSATQNLSWPRTGSYADSSRGRVIAFDSTYTFTELDTSSGETFWTALAALPLEIQRLKKGVFEQAYHLTHNDGLFDTTGQPSTSTSATDRITVGSITISGGSTTATTVPTRSDVTIQFIRPLLQHGGSATWFRAN